ncbi:MAG: hypothetical protein EU542_07625 [Promethearchaeota archaeon]|nr:MAG: hypothetical protein EU542_07625 [Candidatus Lokiarchaeota archaeon]
MILVLLAIFSLFYIFNFGMGHFSTVLNFEIFSVLFLLELLGASGIIIGIIVIIVRSIDFEQGKFESIILNKKYINYEKQVIPIIFFLIVISTIIFIIGNMLAFNLKISTFLTFLHIAIICFLSIWGYKLFQKKPKGKYLFIWLIGFLIQLGAGLFAFYFFGVFRTFPRIFLLSTVPFLIGFAAYFYKLIKTGQIRKQWIKILIISFTIFSIITTFIEEDSYFKSFSIEERELSNLKWYSNFTQERNVLILEFGWEYSIIYYDFPYERNNVYPYWMFEFIAIEEKYISPHVQEISLAALKNEYDIDIYIFLTDYFTAQSGWESFGSLSKREVEIYFNLTYLNRICSTKDMRGIDEPIYWVI